MIEQPQTESSESAELDISDEVLNEILVRLRPDFDHWLAALPPAKRKRLFPEGAPSDDEINFAIVAKFHAEITTAGVKRTAEIAAGKKRIDAAFKIATTRTAEEESLWQGDHERAHTIWWNISDGRSATVVAERQLGDRFVIDASGSILGGIASAYRALKQFLEEPLLDIIASADHVTIVAHDSMPEWLRRDEYSDAGVNDFEIVILLPGRRNRHYAAFHMLAHAVVAHAWGKASKSGLFVVESAAHTKIVNAERECELGDDPERAGNPRVCIPGLGLRVAAAATPGGYASVMDPSPSTVIDCEHVELFPVWDTVLLMLGLARDVTIQCDNEVKLGEFSSFTVRGNSCEMDWWKRFLATWTEGYVLPLEYCEPNYDSRDGDPAFDFEAVEAAAKKRARK
jgi:hypothetical protein